MIFEIMAYMVLELVISINESDLNTLKHYVQYIIHCVSKSVPHLTCYRPNLDIHDPIMTIFGRSVTEKVRNRMMLCFPTSLSSASALPVLNARCIGCNVLLKTKSMQHLSEKTQFPGFVFPQVV